MHYRTARRRFLRLSVTAAAVVSTAALLAACGSSSSKSSSSSAPATSTTSQAVIKLAGAVPMTGQYFEEPEYAAGLKASLAAINASGGVGGHQLSLNVCNTDFTANGEVSCADSIVASHPDAIVGPFFVADSTGAAWPILKAAGLPAIGEQGGTLSELNSTNAFPLGSGFLGPFVGTVPGVLAGGAKKIAIITDNPNPNGPGIAALITKALNARGIKNVKSVTGYTASDPTFSTAASEAISSGTDGVIINGSPSDAATIIKALRGAGYTGTISIPSLLLPAQSIHALGKLANGVVVVDGTEFVTDTANPAVAAYRADMSKYESGATIDDASMQGWSAMQLFAKAAAGAKSFTPAGLMTAFASVSKPIDIGTSAPWSTVGKLGKVPEFARVVNPDIALGVVKNGTVVPEKSGWLDPLGS